jgi:pyrroloquinoline quinone biosynthesis protein D
MTNSGAREFVEAASKPVLVRSVKLRFDETRQVWVLLAPERLLTPSETAVAVLQLCDGVRTVADIAAHLADEFDAPPEAILDDILPLLQDLADRRFLSV